MPAELSSYNARLTISAACVSNQVNSPAPNLIIPFNGEARESVLGAFGTLATVCETLSCASRLITLMPGNERLN